MKLRFPSLFFAGWKRLARRRRDRSHQDNQDTCVVDVDDQEPPIATQPLLSVQQLMSGGYYPSPSGRSYYVYIDGDNVYEVDDDDNNGESDDGRDTNDNTSTTDDDDDDEIDPSLNEILGNAISAAKIWEVISGWCDEVGGKRKRTKVDYNEDNDSDEEEYCQNCGEEDYREETYRQEDDSSECSDISVDLEDLAKLEAIRNIALTLPGLNKKEKKLMEGVFSERTLRHYHDKDGIYVGEKCAKVGGYKAFLDQALHIFKQVASGVDEEGKLKLKRGVKVPVIKVVILLCGTDNEDGTTDHMMGLIDENDPVWSSPTGRILVLFNDALPSIENDIEYGNGPNKFITMEVRIHCKRQLNKKGEVKKPKHCVGPQVKEVNQVTYIFEEFVSAFPKSTKFIVINGGGQASEKIFRGMYANDPRFMRYWRGASHLSQYSSPSHFNHEVIEDDMYKMMHYADQLSLFVELMGMHMVKHCQGLGVVATEAKDKLIDVFWSSSAACMIGNPEKKAMWNDVLTRLAEMRSKGGRNKKGKKVKVSAKMAEQNKKNGQNSNQRILLSEAKKGRGEEDNKEPIQVSYVECGGLRAWGGRPATPCSVNCKKFALKTPEKGSLFSASCPSCGYHSNWDEINEVPSMEPAVWTSVSKLPDDTDKVCGDGNPGLMIGSKQRGTYKSYEAYGCGAKACGEWKSNYPPETAYFCADCEEKLS